MPPRIMAETRARLSLVLPLYCLATVIVVKLAPFDFFVPSQYSFELTIDWRDLASTALLVVPLGFLYPLTLDRQEASVLRVVLLGLFLGIAFVLGQLFQHPQLASLSTAIASGAGAGAGALLLRAMNRRIANSPKLAGRLSLEIPLVALVYLLIPLLVAASFAAGDDRMRMIALVPLALFGSRLISAVQEHQFGPAGVFRKRSIAVVGAGWATLGFFPVLLRDPLIGASLVLLAAISTVHGSAFPAVRGVVSDRRWEAKVIRSVVPYICAYFAVTILLPLAFETTDWRISTGLTGSKGDPAQQLIRLLEPAAALAMVGYVLAEARGRRELPFRAMVLQIAAECAAVALVWEGSRAFQVGAGASVAQFIVMTVASLLGAAIYHHQREHIRWILIYEKPGHRRRNSLLAIFAA